MSRYSALARLALVPAAIVCVVALPGCGSKITQSNYDQIKPEMADADVVKILGTPTSTNEIKGLLGAMSEKVWKDGDKSITIDFMDGKAAMINKTGF